MDQLLICDRCRHCATIHDGTGCQERACSCAHTREDVVEHGCEAARQEMRALWKS